jgi:hypothetical protein
MPKPRTRKRRLEPWLDLQSHLENLEVVDLSFGHDGALYVLAIVPPVDYREQVPPDAVAWPKIRPDRPNDFVVLRCRGHAVNRIEIPNQPWNFHDVQPLADEELLLTCARSMYRGPDDYDQNGQVFDLAGAHRRSFLLGDGIRDVQTTRDGRIWVSYFDEGIFGNFGWDDPVGARGLNCFDRFGHTLYTYNPPDGLDEMADCYALNVAGDQDAWCYYYSDFPLVHLRDYQVAGWWECPIHGSGGFLVYQDMILMRGGWEDGDDYHLLTLLPDGRMQEQMRYAFTNEDNVRMKDCQFAFRESNIVILNGTRCYRTTLPDLL